VRSFLANAKYVFGGGVHGRYEQVLVKQDDT